MSQGHGLDRVLDYTPEQVNLLMHFAIQRLNREIYSDAQTAAIGSAVGFSGQSDILKKLADDLGIEAAKGSAVPSQLRNLLMHAVHNVRKVNRAMTAEDDGGS